MTTMDLHVIPPTGYNDDEVFSVALKHHTLPKDNVWLTAFTRQTKYSKFKTCADKTVDIKLCVCADRLTTRSETIDINIPSEMFGSKTVVQDLDSGCLIILRRDYGSISLALEIANVCVDRTYRFEMYGKAKERVFSKKLPINLELSPKTFYFLTSVNKLVSKDNFPVHLDASIYVKSNGLRKFIELKEVSII